MTRRMALQLDSAVPRRQHQPIFPAAALRPRDQGPPPSIASASEPLSPRSLQLRKISAGFASVGTRLRTLNDELSRNVLLPSLEPSATTSTT